MCGQSMAMNALLGGKNSGHGGSGGGGSSSSPLGSLGGLANQFLGGSHGGSGSGGGSSGGNKPSGAGKLVGQLAQSFMHSASQEKPPAPQNYHNSSGQNSQQQQQQHGGGGIAGQIMGGVATMFGGKHGSSVGLYR
jgi:hypothetical protein